jgi:hypothetical protein
LACRTGILGVIFFAGFFVYRGPRDHTLAGIGCFRERTVN